MSRRGARKVSHPVHSEGVALKSAAQHTGSTQGANADSKRIPQHPPRLRMKTLYLGVKYATGTIISSILMPPCWKVLR